MINIHDCVISEDLRIVCAESIAKLAREDAPDGIAMPYGPKLTFVRNWIIPVHFNPRLIFVIPSQYHEAAMSTWGKPGADGLCKCDDPQVLRPPGMFSHPRCAHLGMVLALSPGRHAKARGRYQSSITLLMSRRSMVRLASLHFHTKATLCRSMTLWGRNCPNETISTPARAKQLGPRKVDFEYQVK